MGLPQVEQLLCQAMDFRNDAVRWFYGGDGSQATQTSFVDRFGAAFAPLVPPCTYHICVFGGPFLGPFFWPRGCLKVAFFLGLVFGRCTRGAHPCLLGAGCLTCICMHAMLCPFRRYYP